MEKSKDFAERLGSDFTPSTGWLARWKNRMGIKFKRAHGEKSSADEAAAENWLMHKLPKLLEEFPETDIFNADETRFQSQLSGSKKALDRITVLICANMSGTEKKKLLVIGKSKNPRCFKRVDVGKLPVTYRWNTKAWLTGVIFMEWISEWDRELREAGRRILLLVDNCSAHPALDTLTNIYLEFLPPNTTSMIQPMDQGVIRNLKVNYRKQLISLTLSLTSRKACFSQLPQRQTSVQRSTSLTQSSLFPRVGDWCSLPPSATASGRLGFERGTPSCQPVKPQTQQRQRQTRQKKKKLKPFLPCRGKQTRHAEVAKRRKKRLLRQCKRRKGRGWMEENVRWMKRKDKKKKKRRRRMTDMCPLPTQKKKKKKKKAL